jgi:hypothetical protein
MRRGLLVVTSIAIAVMAIATEAAVAAELAIPPRKPPADFSIQKGPPNCSRWTDDCVSCSRGTKGEPAVCSNIGFACQPKAIRCLSQ